VRDRVSEKGKRERQGVGKDRERGCGRKEREREGLTERGEK